MPPEPGIAPLLDALIIVSIALFDLDRPETAHDFENLADFLSE
jgi:hypothetical protein